MTPVPSPAPGPGRPARLSREAIVAAALEIDLAELSMHGLARRLGVSHGALYRWVANREALVALVSDVVLERMTPHEGPADGDWRAWLAELGRSIRRVLLEAPGHAHRLVGPHDHPAAYDRLQERVVAVLVADAGLEPDDAVQYWYAFGTSVVGWVATEQARSSPLTPAPRFEVLLETLLGGVPRRR